jgi:hypothetical protein
MPTISIKRLSDLQEQMEAVQTDKGIGPRLRKARLRPILAEIALYKEGKVTVSDETTEDPTKCSRCQEAPVNPLNFGGRCTPCCLAIIDKLPLWIKMGTTTEEEANLIRATLLFPLVQRGEVGI